MHFLYDVAFPRRKKIHKLVLQFFLDGHKTCGQYPRAVDILVKQDGEGSPSSITTLLAG